MRMPLTGGPGRRRSLALGFPGRPEALRSGRPRPRAWPPRGQVLAVARAVPPAQARTVTRGTCEDLGATWLDAWPTALRSRSSLGRLRPAVARTPHTRASWRHSPAEDGEAHAHLRVLKHMNYDS
jgi:hypothetical protein